MKLNPPYLLAGAAVLVLAYFLLAPSNMGGGFLEATSGRFSASTVIPTIAYAIATGDSSTHGYSTGDFVEKIVTIFEAYSQSTHNVEDDSEDIVSINPAMIVKSYFGKEYECVKLPADAMAKFGTSIDRDRFEHKSGTKYYGIGAGTKTMASLKWGDSITWSYPKMTSGDAEKLRSDWITFPILSGVKLVGVTNGIGYSINGWDDTNIAYVSDGSKIVSLAQSGYFDIISMVSQVPATTAEKTTCANSCPKITSRCSSRNSKSTYEACKRRVKAETAIRDACLRGCTTLNVCTYSVNGVEGRDVCTKYSTASLAIGDTITLFKDATARMYSPYEDFKFFADFRGGSTDSYLCALKLPKCGDNECNGVEDCATCPADCDACPAVCGDGTCDESETCECGDCACPEGYSCSESLCQEIPEVIYCTMEMRSCPDGSNMPRAANCTWEQEKCPVVTINGTKTNATDISYCGDGVCEIGAETCSICEKDCGKCLPCDCNEDCVSPMEFGLEAGGGSWSCQSNNCVWTASASTCGVGETCGGGAAEAPVSDYTWLMIASGAVLAGAVGYFLMKRK